MKPKAHAHDRKGPMNGDILNMESDPNPKFMEKRLPKGTGFERQLAYILKDAGLDIRSPAPHPVVKGGVKVGDIDIIAVDSSTGAKVAVSCKEWLKQSPGANELIKLHEMMDWEGIRCGILASASGFKKSIEPVLRRYREQGYVMILLGPRRLEMLHEHKIRGDTETIRSWFEDQLSLLTEGSSQLLGGETDSPESATSEEGDLTSLPFVLKGDEQIIMYDQHTQCDLDDDEYVGTEVYLTNHRLIVVNYESGWFSHKEEVVVTIPVEEIDAINTSSKGVLRRTYWLQIPFRRRGKRHVLAFAAEGEEGVMKWRRATEHLLQSY